ncbi:MAG TPA: TonB-dependent receptor [Longimicrobium sp.]
MKKLRWLLAAVLAVASAGAPLAAQARGTVTGRVVESATQRPVAGATVRVAGLNIGASTDEDGRFTLQNVPAGARTIQATRIGFQQGTANVTVGATPANVTVSLGADPLGLEGIVAIGYGETSRRNVTGSVASIRPEEVQETPSAQIQEVLQGRVAGVQVVQNSGTPGAAMSVRIRGASSISAGNQPLYVIDGVPLISGNFSGINEAFGGQDIDALADLNPNEIESIEVLKDASASAIYGSRASNGVVLVTTRRGRAGTRPEIQFSTYYGTQRAWRMPEFLNAQQYIGVYNEAIANDFGLNDYFGFENDNVENFVEVRQGTNTDWIDEILGSAPIANMTASVAGGTERARYFVSGSRFMQDGIVSGQGYERLNGRVNLDYTAGDRLTLGTNVALTQSLFDRARSDNNIYGPFSNAIASTPIDPVYNEDGTYNLGTLSYDNPVALNAENRAEDRSVRILGNAFANYNLASGLDARVNVGLDYYTLRSALYDSPIVGPATGSQGAGEVGNSYAQKVLTEGTLTYNREIGEDNQITALVGTSYEDNTTDRNSVGGVGFPSLGFRTLSTAALITGGTSSVTGNDLLSFFSRASHTFRDRLTTTLNVRADGSSRFAEGNQWGVFPSAAVLYRLTDEPFMRSQSVVSDLAVRASYGLTGNQSGIGDFATVGAVSGGANYGDRPGLAPSQLPNPDLQWEKTDQLNLGADAAFLNDRLSLSFDWYRKNTTDLLLTRPVPFTTGFAARTENIGSMRNTGVELALRAQIIRPAATNGFSWTSELNLSRNRNEVTNVNGDTIAAGFTSYVIEGQPLGAFYGYRTEGIFRDTSQICRRSNGTGCGGARGAYQSSGTAPGDVRFVDTNGDNIINAADRAIIGSPWPELQGGFTNRLAVAGVDLSVFTQFSLGNDVYNANRIYTDAYGSGFDNNSIRALDRWTPDNPNASEPRATFSDPNANTRDSDRFVEDGSYVRIKNVVLGYNLPQRVTRRFGTNSLRLFVSGENVVTWTDYSGFDPEVNFSGDAGVSRGVDFYTLPQTRTLSFGVNVGL